MRPRPAALQRVDLIARAARRWSSARDRSVPALPRQHAHQRRKVAAQQRLAAGQPDLVDAERQEDVDERADLLEVQHVLARQPDVVVLRHAVFAAQVAAVGDRQPQVAQRPAEAIIHERRT